MHARTKATHDHLRWEFGAMFPGGLGPARARVQGFHWAVGRVEGLRVFLGRSGIRTQWVFYFRLVRVSGAGGLW